MFSVPMPGHPVSSCSSPGQQLWVFPSCGSRPSAWSHRIGHWREEDLAHLRIFQLLGGS